MQLRHKLAGCFVAAVAIVAGLIGDFAIDLDRLDTALNVAVRSSAVLKSTAHELEKNSVEAAAAALKEVQAPDPRHLERLRDSAADMRDHLARFNRLVTSDRMRALGERLTLEFETFYRLGERLIHRRNDEALLYEQMSPAAAAIGMALSSDWDDDRGSNDTVAAASGTAFLALTTVGAHRLEASIAAFQGLMPADRFDEIQRNAQVFLRQAEELRTARHDIRNMMIEFVDLRGRIDALLDDEIQPLADEKFERVVAYLHEIIARVNSDLLLASGIALVALFFLPMAIVRGMNRRLARLMAAVAAIRSGRHERAVIPGAQGSDEIALLSDAFDRMADDVRKVHSQLEATNAGLETEVARRTDDLERTVAALREANAARVTFLANMSHELRTPLNAVIGFSQLVIDDSGGAAASLRHRGYAMDINRAGTHLLAIINEILDLARVDSGQIALDESPVDLCALVDECLRMVLPRAAEKNVALICDCGAACVIMADPRLLRQCVLNLLVNAIKYNRRGGSARVTVQHRLDSFSISVADTGIGIPQDQIDRVIEPFARGGNVYVRAEDGLGLGLALTKRFIELHGGRLEISSAPGEGTVVRLVLPLERLQATLSSPSLFSSMGLA